jgi:drug/metabolite transporter (DMT)-like permease
VKAKSVKYEEPARLAVLNYFQPIMQLILDILYFHSDFTLLQALGAGIIFVANSVNWTIKAKKAFSKKKGGEGVSESN